MYRNHHIAWKKGSDLTMMACSFKLALSQDSERLWCSQYSSLACTAPYTKQGEDLALGVGGFNIAGRTVNPSFHFMPHSIFNFLCHLIFHYRRVMVDCYIISMKPLYSMLK